MIGKGETNKNSLHKGASVVITGASSGIGKSLALELAKNYSARIVINARNKEDLELTAKLIRQAGGEAVCVPGDISDDKVVRELIETCLARFGRLDILVNNAGLTKPGALSELTLSDWRYVFDVNFFAALNLIYAALPHFKKQNAGKIINISSVAGKVSFPGTVCYAASKFALNGLSEGVAAELANTGISVLTVCPGWVRTEFFKKNQTPGDPQAIAEEKNFRGWLMRNILSISSEQAAKEILQAMKKNGSHEIILTLPGVILERMSGLCPKLTFFLASLVPAERSKQAQ